MGFSFLELISKFCSQPLLHQKHPNPLYKIFSKFDASITVEMQTIFA